MPEEVELLRKEINVSEHKRVAGQDYYIGEYEEHDVILVRCGAGKVSAAVGTALLNQLYQPDYVINSGSSGAVSEGLKVGDIIIADRVCYHDVDLTTFGYEYGQASKMPAYYISDSNLVKLALSCADDFGDGAKLIEGLILSGDSFISSPAQLKNIKEHFSNVLALEMEAAAIAQTCHLFEVPFLIVRAISDVPSHENNTSVYKQNLALASERSAKIVLCVLERQVKTHC